MRHLLLVSSLVLGITSHLWLLRLAQSQLSPDLDTLTIKNDWADQLTISLSTETGKRLEVGSVLAGHTASFRANLPPAAQQFDFQARNRDGNVIFSLSLDRDELDARGGHLVFPGRGDRRQQADHPPASPAPTTHPKAAPP